MDNKQKFQPTEEELMKNALDEMESQGGIEYDEHTAPPPPTPFEASSIEKPNVVTSLGKASTSPIVSSLANESGWKLVKLENLPSQGLMYPANMELLIRSAKTREIRHWSTIDEYDPIDVSEKILFVTESCSRMHVKGESIVMNSNDILEIDKYQVLFKIHKITFPNNENKLIAKVKCSNQKCGTINSIHTTDSNLGGFEYPQDIMEWYSAEEKCFVINSKKLSETFRIYIPTIGSTKILNDYKKLCKNRGIEEDKAFDDIAPYLIPNWRTFSANELLSLRNQSNNWHENKFLFLHKATSMLKANSKNKVHGICEKCKTKLASSIFLGGSFTAKDIFIVSTGLRDLI